MVQVGAFIETMEAVDSLSVFSVDPQKRIDCKFCAGIGSCRFTINMGLVQAIK
jgi:hypothetical protein